MEKSKEKDKLPAQLFVAEKDGKMCFNCGNKECSREGIDDPLTTCCSAWLRIDFPKAPNLKQTHPPTYEEVMNHMHFKKIKVPPLFHDKSIGEQNSTTISTARNPKKSTAIGRLYAYLDSQIDILADKFLSNEKRAAAHEEITKVIFELQQLETLKSKHRGY